ncbi:hypothetical protein WJU23_09450 [Prosthecobacter sp. SYSU 5D2]|uniref:hypothetical protein n=1 Tax=Prosthecobacter sp. SYSU 5D2 TaxID=3134134 RepID=UPI0031FE581A
MPFPFSFFGDASPDESFLGPVAAPSDVEGINKADPLPWMEHEQIQMHQASQAQASMTGGLAALAVQQSTSAPLAPPSRRLADYMAPGSAIAASLALAAQGPGSMPAPMEIPPSSPPPASHFNAVQSLQSRDLAQLRMDLEREIEQVRQDLFGAAMGVSALKDRLDDLETTAVKPPAPAAAFSPAEAEMLIRSWLDSHLPSYLQQAVQHSLDRALQHTVSTLSSTEFFRMPVHTSGLNAERILSQAPQILSSSLS